MVGRCGNVGLYRERQDGEHREYAQLTRRLPTKGGARGADATGVPDGPRERNYDPNQRQQRGQDFSGQQVLRVGAGFMPAPAQTDQDHAERTEAAKLLEREQLDSQQQREREAEYSGENGRPARPQVAIHDQEDQGNEQGAVEELAAEKADALEEIQGVETHGPGCRGEAILIGHHVALQVKAQRSGKEPGGEKARGGNPWICQLDGDVGREARQCGRRC